MVHFPPPQIRAIRFGPPFAVPQQTQHTLSFSSLALLTPWHFPPWESEKAGNKKKSTQIHTFWARWGQGLPHEGVRVGKFVPSL